MSSGTDANTMNIEWNLDSYRTIVIATFQVPFAFATFSSSQSDIAPLFFSKYPLEVTHARYCPASTRTRVCESHACVAIIRLLSRVKHTFATIPHRLILP
jgi:hypothetical protein